MPSTYTTNNGIELIGTGEQSGTWGDTTNTNLTLVDASLDGHTSITLTGAGTSGSPNDVPITNGATSNGRNRALIFTDGGDLGGSVYVRLTPNDAKKIMFVRNSLSGSRDLILFQGTYNASNDFVLAAGKDAIVKFDGGGSGAVASAVLADFALDAATITTISNTTLNTATVNATTVDTTNIEVTNLKAKDGTSAGSIADSTGVVTLASSVLTTTDINGGTIDGTTIGGSTPAAVTGTTITGTGFVTTGDMTFGDDDKAIFGAGSDLSIYHDGSNSYIEEAGAGALKVTSNGTGVDFESAGGETLAQFETNGAVTLYHNNSQKLATTSSGVDVTGTANATTVDTTNIEVTNLKAKDGTSAGSIADATGVVTLNQLQLGTTAIDAADADAALTPGFYKWADLSSGASNWPSDFTSGPAALQVFPSMNANNLVQVAWHLNNPENLYIRSYRSSSFKTWRKVLVEDENGDISVSNDLLFGDDDKAIFGAGSDLQIYHDGSNSYIKEAGTGDLKISGNNLWLEDASGNTYFRAVNSSYAKMYHSGSEKLATTSTGIDVTGTGLFSSRVGIGTDLGSNPSGADPDADNLVIDAGGADAGITIDTGTAAKGSLFFADGGTGDALKRGQIVYDHNGDYMTFATNAVERLRLVSSGAKIGTGVDGHTNADELVISKDQTNVGMSLLAEDATGNVRLYLGSQTDKTAAKIQHNENNDELTIQAAGALQLQSGGAVDRVVIDSSGNVGIGNSSPSVPLDVTGNAAVSGKTKIGGGADGASNGDELVISKDQTNVGMSILAADATGICRILFGSQTSTNAAKIQHSESNSRLFVQAEGDIYFQTGGSSTTMTLNGSGDLDVTGALSKGSGSFKISHPLKPDTHHLVHSFIEGPQADNIYRGTVALVGGSATVNLDTAGRMSEGTFVALNGNVQCLTSNEQGWTAVRGSVSGNILTIEAQDATCTDTVSWMVVGERKDQHMIDTHWTDAAGRVITEPEKPPVEEDETV